MPLAGSAGAYRMVNAGPAARNSSDSGARPSMAPWIPSRSSASEIAAVGSARSRPRTAAWCPVATYPVMVLPFRPAGRRARARGHRPLRHQRLLLQGGDDRGPLYSLVKAGIRQFDFASMTVLEFQVIGRAMAAGGSVEGLRIVTAGLQSGSPAEALPLPPPTSLASCGGMAGDWTVELRVERGVVCRRPGKAGLLAVPA